MDDSGPGALRDALNRVGRVMQQVDDLDRLLAAIIEECKRLLGCEACSVALYDAERNDLSFAIASGGAESGIRQWRLPMGQGIVGTVAQTRRAIVCNDPASDPRWFGKTDETLGFITRNLATVPMLYGGELSGALQVLNTVDGRDFSENDLLLLQVFADQASVALAIHRLFLAKQQSERLSAFAVALADIGHSVKNILMRLQFPLGLIDEIEQKKNWSKFSQIWPVLKRAIGDISALVQDMLAYSKARRPEIEQVDVAALIREAADVLKPDACARRIALELSDMHEELPWLLEASSLRAALNNLLGNAIEAIAEHGGSRIAVAATVAPTGEELRISIADDGPGMPPEIQQRVFNPFFSTKGSKGTGLGLANVKKSVEEHGGRVLLESAPGKGATFTLVFPQFPATA